MPVRLGGRMRMRSRARSRRRNTSSYSNGRNYSRKQSMYISEYPSNSNPFIAVINISPSETKKMIVFPWDVSRKNFKIEKFSKEKLNGKVSKKEVDRVFELVKKCENFDPKIDSLKKSENSVCVMLGLSLLIIMSLYLIFMLTEQITIGVIVLFGGLSLLTFFAISLLFKITPEYTKMLKIREKSIKKILRDISVKSREKGVVWNCGTYGAWITIEIFGGLELFKKEEKEEKEKEEKKKASKGPPRAQNPKKSNPVNISHFAKKEKVKVAPNPFVEKKLNHEEKEFYKPENIGFAGVVNPNKEGEEGNKPKPYNPPIIDVNIERKLAERQ